MKAATNERLLHRVAHFGGVVEVVVEGIYVQSSMVDKLWRLTHWRMFSRMNPPKPEPEVRWGRPSGPSGWYKIHGNRKRDIGSLKLFRWESPAALPIPAGIYHNEDRRTLRAALGLDFDTPVSSDVNVLIAKIEDNPGQVDAEVLIAADALAELPGWDYDAALARVNRHEYFGYLIKNSTPVEAR